VANLNPAPLQVSFHGGATTGLEEMDAWFTDAILHPDDTTERFTEDLVRLPNFYAYPTQDNAPEVSNLPADTNGFITFISFNKPCKMNESVLDLWSEILKVVPGSRLMLKYRNYLGVPSLRQRILCRFEENGVSTDLIELRSAVDNFEEHMAGYHRADIALDTFPFAGATTTFQALWMGVPVISFMGDRFISRAGGSISTQAGLGELAVDTPEKYIETARALAADLPRLRGLRSGLRQRMATSPLCDGPAYACAVENAFRSLWADKFGGGS
jgi:predicted O-linked N-acetylglucosamine transferase (SPINDLY family)